MNKFWVWVGRQAGAAWVSDQIFDVGTPPIWFFVGILAYDHTLRINSAERKAQ